MAWRIQTAGQPLFALSPNNSALFALLLALTAKFSALAVENEKARNPIHLWRTLNNLITNQYLDIGFETVFAGDHAHPVAIGSDRLSVANLCITLDA